LRISVNPGGRYASRAATGELNRDHGLDAADEDQFRPGGLRDFEADEEADFFQTSEFGRDGEAVAQAGRFEVVDFGAHDDGDEPGAAHFLEAPTESGGELRAGDLNHAQVGDVMDDSPGIGVEVVDLKGDADAGLDGEGRGAHGRGTLNTISGCKLVQTLRHPELVEGSV
jgi:hypothetical protein